MATSSRLARLFGLPLPTRRDPRCATLAFLAVILLGVAACSSASHAAENPSPAPTVSPTKVLPTAIPTVEKNPPLPASKPLDPAVEAKVQKILEDTATVRSLPIKAKVPLGTISRPQLRSYLMTAFEQQNARQELEQEKAILVALDLLRETDSLYDLELGLLSQQIIGLYDFDAKEMRIVGTIDQLSPMDELTLSHEFVHALQDQNFDAGNEMRKTKGNGERQSALDALIEGDATYSSVMYMQKALGIKQSASSGQQSAEVSQEKLASAPPVVQLGALFPYLQGAAFVADLDKTGGWSAVDKAFSNPPTTVSQIMHPDKYLAGKAAQPVEAPKVLEALGSEWVLSRQDMLGELGVLSYLANSIPIEQATKAADGWAGDVELLFRSRSGYDYTLVIVLAWDTPQDATEFFSAVHDLRQAKKDYTPPEGNHLSWTTVGRSGYVSIRGDKTALAITTSDATMKKVVSALESY